jgi:hypothetical protein
MLGIGCSRSIGDEVSSLRGAHKEELSSQASCPNFE